MVTLVLGLMELNKAFQSSRERRQAVAELVHAASMRSDEKEFSAAWQLIDDALALEPGCRLARDGQVTLAMTWLNSLPWDRIDSIPVIKRLLPVLYRGAARSDRLAADVLAYLGWAKYQLAYLEDTPVSVDKYFMQSLEIDPNNLYGNKFWGIICLRRVYSKKEFKRPTYDNNLDKAIGPL